QGRGGQAGQGRSRGEAGQAGEARRGREAGGRREGKGQGQAACKEAGAPGGCQGEADQASGREASRAEAGDPPGGEETGRGQVGAQALTVDLTSTGGAAIFRHPGQAIAPASARRASSAASSPSRSD